MCDSPAIQLFTQFDAVGVRRTKRSAPCVATGPPSSPTRSCSASGATSPYIRAAMALGTSLRVREASSRRWRQSEEGSHPLHNKKHQFHNKDHCSDETVRSCCFLLTTPEVALLRPITVGEWLCWPCWSHEMEQMGNGVPKNTIRPQRWEMAAQVGTGKILALIQHCSLL